MKNDSTTATASPAFTPDAQGEVSVSAAELRARRPATRGQLHDLLQRNADASDLPSRAGHVEEPGSVRGAILRAMADRHVGRAELHRRASAIRPGLSRARVDGFIAGTSEVTAGEADAMLRALGLVVAAGAA